MSPTITVASFFSFFRQTTECMRSGHFFFITTKILDRQAETHLSAKGPPFRVLDFQRKIQNRMGLQGVSPFEFFFGTVRHFFELFVAEGSSLQFF